MSTTQLQPTQHQHVHGPDCSHGHCQTIRKEPKIGRNDPCPCKSGLKFKKCCGKD